MDCIILAAGMGTRLKELTKEKNKCAIKIGDKPIITRLVDNFATNQLGKIYIVTGYKVHSIKEALQGNEKINYIYNPLFHSTGILVSVWLAKRDLYGKRFFMSTGDNFCHPQVLNEFLKAQGDTVVAVKKKFCSPGDVKVAVQEDRIIKFEEDYRPEDAVGEFGMMLIFSETTSKIFFDIVEEYLESGKHKVRLIDTLNAMINRGYKITPFLFEDGLSVEMDTYEDLQKAQELEKKFYS